MDCPDKGADRGTAPMKISALQITVQHVGLFGLFVVALWAASFGLLAAPWSWEQLSHLGGMFGVVNALFSGLALVGVVAAIILQGQELREQRREIKEEGKTLERQLHAMRLAAEVSASASILQFAESPAGTSLDALSIRADRDEALARLRAIVVELEGLHLKAKGPLATAVGVHQDPTDRETGSE